MTGPEGNSEFFFPENLNVSRDEVEVVIGQCNWTVGCKSDSYLSQSF